MNVTFTTFDAAEYLDSDEAIAAYLNEVIESGDPDLLLSALSDIARARGMAKVAEDSGLGRESLYKALRPGAKPGFVTVSKIMEALGVRMKVKVKVPTKKAKSDSSGKKILSRKASAKSAPAAKRRSAA
ncbi:addiction module antidote protein [Dyella silvae]|uniref:addiction module antidote protein n=1 Tax=Dyella silvae TaxID=2994424 RepID=UPI002B267CDC|nr:addiction module antidote protein [Dyella silvae]